MTDSPNTPSRARAWLQLVRAPNLLTVPGDPLAGWLLAAGGAASPALPLVLLASLGFYAAGLVTNDLADLATDRRERPDRPLPSGRIGLPAARLAAGALLVAALLLCAAVGRMTLLVGGLLTAAILAYNGRAKTVPLLGPATMGVCRGLNLLLGVAASYPWWAGSPAPRLWLALGAAAVLTIYIIDVTLLARREVETGRAGLIGALIRGLLPLQAMFCFIAGAGWPGAAAGAALLALWPVSRWLSRRFYMS